MAGIYNDEEEKKRKKGVGISSKKKSIYERAGIGLREGMQTTADYGRAAIRNHPGVIAGKYYAKAGREFVKGVSGEEPQTPKTVSSPYSPFITGPQQQVRGPGAKDDKQQVRGPGVSNKKVIPTWSGTPAPGAEHSILIGRGKIPTRQVSYGGLQQQPIRQEPSRPRELRRVADLGGPETIGDMPMHRRRMGAVKFDIEAQQKQDQLTASQQQAGVDQKQKQDQLTASQQQAGVDQQLAASTLAMKGKELSARTAAEQSKTDQRQIEIDRQSTALEQYESAETPAEKMAAAQRFNALAGKGIDLPKAGKSNAMTPEQASQQITGMAKLYDEGGGEATYGDFFDWMKKTNPRAYLGQFGQLKPGQVRHYSELSTMSDEEMMSSEWVKGKIKEGETPASFRARLETDYRKLRGY